MNPPSNFVEVRTAKLDENHALMRAREETNGSKPPMELRPVPLPTPVRKTTGEGVGESAALPHRNRNARPFSTPSGHALKTMPRIEENSQANDMWETNHRLLRLEEASTRLVFAPMKKCDTKKKRSRAAVTDDVFPHDLESYFSPVKPSTVHE